MNDHLISSPSGKENVSGQNAIRTFKRSSDIHQQAEQLDTWDQSYCQLSSGEFHGSVESIWIDGVRFFVEAMNRAVLQKGDVGKDRIGVGVPLKLQGDSILCGEVVSSDSLLVFSGDSGFEYLSPGGFTFVGIEFAGDHEAMTEHHKLLFEHLERSLAKGRRVITLDNAEGAQLGENLSRLFSELSLCVKSLSQGEACAGLHRKFIGTLLDALPEALPVRKAYQARTLNYWRLASEIRDIVEELPERPMSVSELALQLKVSRRTLQNAIRSTVGVSPIEFLRALRLSGVRKELRYARSVTEAATQWGFWHFGRFASDYRTMFGERPSDTLKQLSS